MLAGEGLSLDFSNDGDFDFTRESQTFFDLFGDGSAGIPRLGIGGVLGLQDHSDFATGLEGVGLHNARLAFGNGFQLLALQNGGQSKEVELDMLSGYIIPVAS